MTDPIASAIARQLASQLATSALTGAPLRPEPAAGSTRPPPGPAWPASPATSPAAPPSSALTTRNTPPAAATAKEGADMATVRAHHYRVDPANLEELLARRATVIAGIRANFPGLSQTRLTRLEDGTYSDVRRWDSAEQMHAALAAARAFAPSARPWR